MLNNPWGVAVNERNEIAVTDNVNNRVQIFSSDGTWFRSFGRKGNEQGEFDFPAGIAFDKNGNIIVVDSRNHRVQFFSGQGEYLNQFGEKGNLDHQLMLPTGLSVNCDGNIIVEDTNNKLVKMFSPSGQLLQKISGEGCLTYPIHCVQYENYLIISDSDEYCIKVLDGEGNFLYKFGKKGEGDGRFNAPGCLSVNKAGHLMGCDKDNHRIQVFELSGKFVTKFGTKGSGIGEFIRPVSTAVLSDGFWKLNTSLLSEIRYIEEIKTTIKSTVNQYKDDTTVNPALLWEMIKLKVREKTISYAAYKNATTKRQEEALESEIALLENQLDNAENNNPSFHIVAERITTLKKDLEKIIEYRTKGAIIRSKSLWYNEGEKNSKYFLNLEKRHCKHGTISQLKVNDSYFVTTDKDILAECTEFYRNLYTSKIPDCFQSSVFAKVNTTSLTQEEQTLCEGKLTQKECFEALKNMNPDKTPGTDGLPAEFYKVFWIDIAPFLISALNYAFDSGCLSVS
ncbi:hypothetical protein ACROYT_G008516 [Oculina patagonica]